MLRRVVLVDHLDAQAKQTERGAERAARDGQQRASEAAHREPDGEPEKAVAWLGLGSVVSGKWSGSGLRLG